MEGSIKSITPILPILVGNVACTTSTRELSGLDKLIDVHVEIFIWNGYFTIWKILGLNMG